MFFFFFCQLLNYDESKIETDAKKSSTSQEGEGVGEGGAKLDKKGE